MPRTSWSIPNSSRDASSTGLALSGGRMWWAAPIAAWADGCTPTSAGRSLPRLPKGRLSRRKPWVVALEFLLSAASPAIPSGYSQPALLPLKMVYRGGRGSHLDDECASPFSDDSGLRSSDLDHRERSDEMVHFVGLDVSVKTTSVCVVDDAGKVILEQKVPTDPADIIAILSSLGVSFGRIGIEAGPLSQWLVNALTAANLPVICVETRHMKALLTAQQISKTDRNDARGIAQMMRVGLFKPVHVKTLVAQEQRMLLTSRKLLQRKLLDVEADLRGTLRNFGLKVGVVSGGR